MRERRGKHRLTAVIVLLACSLAFFSALADDPAAAPATVPATPAIAPAQTSAAPAATPQAAGKAAQPQPQASPLEQKSAKAAKPKREFQWQRFVGKFHTVVLHFPIGFITLVFILELFTIGRANPPLRRTIGGVLFLGVVSAVVTTALGLYRAQEGGYNEHTLNMHKWFGVGVTAMIFVTLVIEHSAMRRWSRSLLWVYRFLLAGCVGALALAGHMGGNLTHGSKYLTEDAPDSVRQYLAKDAPDIVREILGDMGPDETTSTPDTSGMDDGQREFVEKIRPIFQHNCYQCHGPEKQKGKYRLDDAEIAFKGGDSGSVAIKPGSPMQSNLIRVITLMPEDDDVMPPSGKGNLTSDEIIAILRWIERGAPFVGAGDAPKPEPVKAEPVPVNAEPAKTEPATAEPAPPAVAP
jgi:uncharacterized membrane protein/mono/diheme cytochrome c family protein